MSEIPITPISLGTNWPTIPQIIEAYHNDLLLQEEARKAVLYLLPVSVCEKSASE